MKPNTRFGSGVALVACTVASFMQSGVAIADGPRDYVLHSAIRRGDLAVLRSHLREGVPVNVQTSEGTTPLMLAALYGTADTVRLLLDQGADPNAADKQGATALLFAAGDLEKVRLLVDRGANVNARSALGNTPLLAAAAHPDNLEVVKWLLEKGADVHAKNANNVSVLAAAIVASDAATARFLLEKGCQPDQINNLFGAAGNSLLEIAAQYGSGEIVELLLARAANVNASDPNFAGHALNYALLSQKPEIARRLIEAGADLKICSPIGKVPPIVFAAYSEVGDSSVAKLMIERGADASANNHAGETALTWARRRGFPEVIALLAGAGTPDPVDHRVDVPNRELSVEGSSRDQLLRSAVEKSVALLQRSSDVFLENRRSCVSCHHQSLPSVALGWARDRGFSVDEASIERINDRQSDSWSRRVQAAYEMDRPFPVPPQLLGYGLWGLSAVGGSADTVTDALVWYLAATQKSDGHWAEGGISRPPMGGGEIMVTTLGMRALQLYPLQGRRDEMHARVDSAKRWLAKSGPATHQERAFKLLGLAWAGASADELSDELQTIQAAQRADGGWPQLPHLASDAWATGQALVALRIAGGVPAADPAYQRGIGYLLRTQFDDGSWYVQSRAWPFQPSFDSAFPFGKDQWISAGATAWATMALVLQVAPTTPSVVPDKSDRHSEPLVAAASPANSTAHVAIQAPVGAQRRTEPLDFARDIKPVLERSCAACHSGEKPEGGFRVTERDAIIRGGESGEAAILPGRSGQSPLFTRASGYDPDLAMPPPDKRDKYPALSKDELQQLRGWIDEGAQWPSDVSIKPPSH